MSAQFFERLSDSPYVERVMHGYTEAGVSTVRPAETHWHMVFVRLGGRIQPIFAGALPTSGSVHFREAELLWIKFRLGTFMPHLPARDLIDRDTFLPGASSRSFWLHGSAWEFPSYENVETFVNCLVRDEVLMHDPLIDAVLKGENEAVSPRTLRHRFLRATGLTQGTILQIERAKRASALLEQGTSILDTVYEAGYFDQPHLTRSLKRFIGKTPAQQLAHASTEYAGEAY